MFRGNVRSDKLFSESSAFTSTEMAGSSERVQCTLSGKRYRHTLLERIDEEDSQSVDSTWEGFETWLH
jgi:hypothetical protein